MNENSSNKQNCSDSWYLGPSSAVRTGCYSFVQLNYLFAIFRIIFVSLDYFIWIFFCHLNYIFCSFKLFFWINLSKTTTLNSGFTNKIKFLVTIFLLIWTIYFGLFELFFGSFELFFGQFEQIFGSLEQWFCSFEQFFLLIWVPY